MTKKYFGTDGIRGTVGEYPITPDFFLKLGWAAGRVFAREGQGFVLVGKDTRISGYMFESALEAGLAAAGVNTRLLGPMPTPGIAYLTRTLRAQAGIVISASHNPYYDNGIKFFSTEGTKLPDELEHKIEYYLDQSMTTVESAQLGKAQRISDAAGRYIEFCKASIPASIDFSGLRIVVDCANGATYHIAPHVFREVGAEVIEIATEPDGLNINEKCGATKTDLLKNAVINYRADLGIALDGDGDRLIMVDDTGEEVDGDELIFIIAKARKVAGKLQGPVVGTQMTNLGMEHALKKLKIDLLRANVGDRYVMELMQQHGSLLGGEGSGHIICLDRTTTGDGVVAALQVLAEVHRTGKSLYALKSEMSKYPQVLVNVKVTQKVDPNSNEVIQKAVKVVEKELGDSGRVLLRASGTEPLIRVMIEGVNEDIVRKHAHELADVVKNAITA
ncbi:phosphoglucosamine mutase [methanotrophic endosymbiont of Bathymodiolus puteoserpentis (Logatchev)]|jgi:phosphoglucosamine mutase|uniref:phosphoglucosamine mutase n=1 Tax=methanotrophic endosymbiont of Bathymodiolus puteoserpentis (Logatchev) TaxID=343235 RepID=UPI0013C868AA|nr:phosphoglucosamine mutase [methanotrophic endosymbiont of Bathymodiolus puteoserpentis (Logatchev)]SHE23709.1 Phosphoglucosamine mutase [methanotrophic endosymbiont of Bathymodiolus puteoserpentis (Logatchev)]